MIRTSTSRAMCRLPRRTLTWIGLALILACPLLDAQALELLTPRKTKLALTAEQMQGLGVPAGGQLCIVALSPRDRH